MNGPQIAAQTQFLSTTYSAQTFLKIWKTGYLINLSVKLCTIKSTSMELEITSGQRLYSGTHKLKEITIIMLQVWNMILIQNSNYFRFLETIPKYVFRFKWIFFNILFRAGIPPFSCARTVLEKLKETKVIGSDVSKQMKGLVCVIFLQWYFNPF